MGRRERRSGDPIRIAFLTPTLDIGGAERQQIILAAGLPADEFDVRFLVLADRGAFAADAEAAGARVHEIGLSRGACVPLRPGCIGAALEAARRYRRLTRDVDVVDAWLIPSMIVATLLRPIAGVPVVIGGRRSIGAIYAAKPWYRRALARLAARRVDA